MSKIVDDALKRIAEEYPEDQVNIDRELQFDVTTSIDIWTDLVTSTNENYVENSLPIIYSRDEILTLVCDFIADAEDMLSDELQNNPSLELVELVDKIHEHLRANYAELIRNSFVHH